MQGPGGRRFGGDQHRERDQSRERAIRLTSLFISHLHLSDPPYLHRSKWQLDERGACRPLCFFGRNCGHHGRSRSLERSLQLGTWAPENGSHPSGAIPTKLEQCDANGQFFSTQVRCIMIDLAPSPPDELSELIADVAPYDRNRSACAARSATGHLRSHGPRDQRHS